MYPSYLAILELWTALKKLTVKYLKLNYIVGLQNKTTNY